jgi:hypothetical protein
VLAGCAPCEDVVEQMESRPGTMEIAQMVAEGELTPTPLVRRLPHLPIEVAHLVHRLLAPVAEDRAPGTSRTNAAFDLAEEILELDGRLMQSQKRPPVGVNAVESVARALPAAGRQVTQGHLALPQTESADGAEDGKVVALPVDRRARRDGAESQVTQAEPWSDTE